MRVDRFMRLLAAGTLIFGVLIAAAQTQASAAAGRGDVRANQLCRPVHLRGGRSDLAVAPTKGDAIVSAIEVTR